MLIVLMFMALEAAAVATTAGSISALDDHWRSGDLPAFEATLDQVDERSLRPHDRETLSWYLDARQRFAGDVDRTSALAGALTLSAKIDSLSADGRFDLAQSTAQRQIEGIGAVLGEAHPLILLPYLDLTALYIYQGNAAGFRATYDSLLVALPAAAGPPHPWRAELSLRQAYYAKNLMEDRMLAVNSFRSVVAEHGATVGRESALYAGALTGLGVVLGKAGREAEGADTLVVAAELLRRVDPESEGLINTLDMAVAAVRRLGQYDRAQALLEEAVALESRRGVSALVRRGLLVRMADGALESGEYDEVRRHLSVVAAIDDSLQVSVQHSLSPGTVSEDHAHDRLAHVLLEADRADDAWRVLECARNRFFARVLAFAGLDAVAGETLTAAGLDTLFSGHLSDGSEAIIRSLPADAALIGWCHPHWRDRPVSWGYVVTRQGITWRRLPIVDSPFAAAERFKERLAEPSAAIDDEFVVARGALWELYLKPLLPDLTGTRRVVIVPDDWTVPFELLGPDEEPMLGERFEVSYTPSATTFAFLSKRERDRSRREGGLALAAATGTETAATTSGRRRRAISGAPPAARSAEEWPGELALPSTRDEVRYVAACSRETTLVLMGHHATERALVSELTSSQPPRFIHLASHAVIDETDPYRSAILLHPGDGTTPDDGWLSARDVVRGPRLDTELVTLSACDTGPSDSGRGGLVGMTSAFMEAGAGTILSTRWAVDDEATSLLMKTFYCAWLNDGGSKAAALAEAQAYVRALRDPSGRQPFGHPYYWAGFTLVGAIEE